MPIIGHKVAEIINSATLVNRDDLLHFAGHLAEILDGGRHSADIQCADRVLAKLGYKPDLAACACTKSPAFHAKLKAVKEVVKAQKTALIKRGARDRRPRQDPNGDDNPQNFRSMKAK